MVITYFIKLYNPYHNFEIYSEWVYFETNTYKYNMVSYVNINMSGYIYCFSNQSLDGIYKIGFTTRDICSRLCEMNRPATHRLCDDIYKLEFAKKNR
jgi:hypothetical protein